MNQTWASRRRVHIYPVISLESMTNRTMHAERLEDCHSRATHSHQARTDHHNASEDPNGGFPMGRRNVRSELAILSSVSTLKSTNSFFWGPAKYRDNVSAFKSSPDRHAAGIAQWRVIMNLRSNFPLESTTTGGSLPVYNRSNFRAHSRAARHKICCRKAYTNIVPECICGPTSFSEV